MLVVAAFLAMVIAMSRIRLKVVLKNLKPLLFIILLTAVLNLFYGQGEPHCAVLDLQDHEVRPRKRAFSWSCASPCWWRGHLC